MRTSSTLDMKVEKFSKLDRPVTEHVGRRRLDLNALLHSLGQDFLSFSV